MKIALGLMVLISLAAVPAGAQTIGGATVSVAIPMPQVTSQKLPWTPPAVFNAIEVSGTESTYVPSTFVTFEGAVAAGKVELKKQTKTVAQAANDSREAAKFNAARVRFAQDDQGRVVLSRN